MVMKSQNLVPLRSTKQPGKYYSIYINKVSASINNNNLEGQFNYINKDYI